MTHKFIRQHYNKWHNAIIPGDINIDQIEGYILLIGMSINKSLLKYSKDKYYQKLWYMNKKALINTIILENSCLKLLDYFNLDIEYILERTIFEGIKPYYML